MTTDLKETNKKSAKTVKPTPDNFLNFDYKKHLFVSIIVLVSFIILLIGTIVYYVLESPHRNETITLTATSEETTKKVDELMLNGNTNVAIEELNRAISSTDDVNKKAEMYYELARAYSYVGDKDRQYESLKAIIGLDSNIDNFQLYSSLASLAYNNGDYEGAEQYILIVIDALNDSGGDYSLEIKDYNKFLQEVRDEIN